MNTPNTKYLVIDTNYFYLNSKLDEYEYLRLTLSLFPEELVELHDLN